MTTYCAPGAVGIRCADPELCPLWETCPAPANATCCELHPDSTWLCDDCAELFCQECQLPDQDLIEAEGISICEACAGERTGRRLAPRWPDAWRCHSCQEHTDPDILDALDGACSSCHLDDH